MKNKNVAKGNARVGAQIGPDNTVRGNARVGVQRGCLRHGRVGTYRHAETCCGPLCNACGQPV